MTEATLGAGAVPLNVGAVIPPFQQQPYREARLGSGVLCSGQQDGIECESPLTTRLRSGKDSAGRPLGEYLCETCGTVFLGVTYSVDPGVRFEEVVADDGDLTEVRPISVGTAVRRQERLAKAGKAPQAPKTYTCEECGSKVLGRRDLDYHRRAYHLTW